MHTSLSCETKVLHRVFTLAQHIEDRITASKRFIPPKSSQHLESPCSLYSHYILPEPAPILSELMSLDLDREAAIIFSDAYMRAAERIKATCEIQYGRVHRATIQRCKTSSPDIQKTAHTLQLAYVTNYMRMLKTWFNIIVKCYVPRALHHKGQSPGQPETSGSRRPFTSAVVAVLEAFFVENAFPTRDEKHELAAETHMDYRQIHVWFQNRRNRSREKGKAVKNGVQAQLPSDLEEAMTTILEKQWKDENTDLGLEDAFFDTSCIPRTLACDILDRDAPPHAYPTTYPPSCDYQPFPILEGHHAFSTPWARKPVTTSGCMTSSIDVSSLTEMFANLSLEAHSSSGHKMRRIASRETSTRGSSADWRVAVAPVAPLAALQVSSYPRRNAGNPSSPINCALPKTAHSLPTRSAICSSTRTRTSRTRVRKPMALPRRLPKSQSRSHAKNQLSGPPTLDSRPDAVDPQSSSHSDTSSSGPHRYIKPYSRPISPPSYPASCGRKAPKLYRQQGLNNEHGASPPGEASSFGCSASRSASLTSSSSVSLSSCSETESPLATPPSESIPLFMPKLQLSQDWLNALDVTLANLDIPSNLLGTTFEESVLST
ncbi:HD2 mating type protein [Gelatoporia subvermispora B]|uniref:HD2 mating type protein n=1 Tax=Ceriporiopsis subvermispora (strain B) TaxID=914234 RepID=M2RTY5_CERS8|nr:HD2 mating type protein [Gelatoporia subvermispora B]